jgi:hypothetical protein
MPRACVRRFEAAGCARVGAQGLSVTHASLPAQGDQPHALAGLEHFVRLLDDRAQTLPDLLVAQPASTTTAAARRISGFEFTGSPREFSEDCGPEVP